ncbi:hypothetical protein PanWU01x14_164170 [Parasponia andersonii]|uniref:Uncharacterized protein n=1 Tax=Parasponia andersonii TaxID=3476 RepID=A0A2P5CCX4_PARAD|nr:hypothetical protein PanWU01x14_164170 [Parasponia andersonii]
MASMPWCHNALTSIPWCRDANPWIMWHCSATVRHSNTASSTVLALRCQIWRRSTIKYIHVAKFLDRGRFCFYYLTSLLLSTGGRRRDENPSTQGFLEYSKGETTSRKRAEAKETRLGKLQKSFFFLSCPYFPLLFSANECVLLLLYLS